jgi:hypothetical protein
VIGTEVKLSGKTRSIIISCYRQSRTPNNFGPANYFLSSPNGLFLFSLPGIESVDSSKNFAIISE